MGHPVGDIDDDLVYVSFHVTGDASECLRRQR